MGVAIGAVEDALRHSLIERDTEQDTALAGHQRVAMIAEPRDVGGERRHCPGLATSSPNHGCELVDALQWLEITLSPAPREERQHGFHITPCHCGFQDSLRVPDLAVCQLNERHEGALSASERMGD